MPCKEMNTPTSHALVEGTSANGDACGEADIAAAENGKQSFCEATR
jgi:hypothetical protein